ncbi:polyisoprenoid-binding protein [Ectothiorhodospiraceae bacterium WFHF3C12]|nr:polyisoprenoid-binding protein [Ectothiorhodospiraceae bacterium WFHF3C12]
MRIIFAGFALALLAAPGLAAAADTYKIDSSHTYPNFTVSHLGFSTMHGRFNETTGTIVMDREGGDSAVDITIQTASIDTGHDKRDEHLRSADFFNVSEYPTITYKSENVYFQGEDSATVTGNLTMLGTTKRVTLHVNSINCGEHPMSGDQVCGFNAITTVKRSDFGMTKFVPAISDEIDIRIEAEAVRQ